jgi:mannosyl-oligosaccharide alpha-1,2-mannosidase
MLMKSTAQEYVYFGESYGGRNSVSAQFGHLHCFIGGTYTMMAQYSKSEESQKEEFEIGEGVGRTCHAMYEKTATGLGSSGVSFGTDITVTSRDYVLRPEAIESWFYLYRYTKDEKYRKWAWDAFLALRKHCRVDGGYAGLRDVNRPGSHEDTMETFLLAETFKYLYCIFSTEKDCDLSKYVLNTEAHFTPILDPTKNKKYEKLYTVMQKL